MTAVLVLVALAAALAVVLIPVGALLRPSSPSLRRANAARRAPRVVAVVPEQGIER